MKFAIPVLLAVWPLAAHTDPPLTTLAQPVRAMADAAVELLMGRLDGSRKRRKRKVFDFELHQGPTWTTRFPSWAEGVGQWANQRAGASWQPPAIIATVVFGWTRARTWSSIPVRLMVDRAACHHA